jgi:uncharacterized membrane protein
VLDRLVRGFPGHPLHPPLTDATIGMYTLATALAVVSYAGYIERPAAHGAWLALIGGLVVTAPTALTGFFDWVTLEWSSPPWRTATAHLTAMLSATALFALAAWQDKAGYDTGHVTGAGLVLAALGFAALTLGGWLGGSIVFVHGVRVLNRREAPASDAASPTPKTTTTEA